MTRRFIRYSAKTCFLLSMFFGIPAILWLYSIGIELNKRLDAEHKINRLFLKIPFWYSIIYLIIGPFIAIALISSSGSFNKILPWHFAAMLSILIIMINDARLISKFEKQNNFRETGIGITFFQLWFYPIGIWTLQPKINKYSLYEKKYR